MSEQFVERNCIYLIHVIHRGGQDYHSAYLTQEGAEQAADRLDKELAEKSQGHYSIGIRDMVLEPHLLEFNNLTDDLLKEMNV